MSDEAATADTPTVEQDAAPVPDPAAQPETDWKARAREWEKRAKANAVAAKRLEEIEASQKSEAEKLTEANASLKAEAESARVELLRFRVGTSYGLPAEAIERLKGADEDELKADAEKLSALFKVTPPVAGPATERLRPGNAGVPEDTPDSKTIAAKILERRYG